MLDPIEATTLSLLVLCVELIEQYLRRILPAAFSRRAFESNGSTTFIGICWGRIQRQHLSAAFGLAQDEVCHSGLPMLQLITPATHATVAPLSRCYG